MAHFLLIYDRRTGTLLRRAEFETGSEALDARFAAEAEYGARPDIEILAISAASEADLRKSHGRYFFTGDELGERFAASK